MASKQVRYWSQILISSSDWSWMQNKINFNWQFNLEKYNFWNVTELRQIICHCELFFVTSMDSGSIPQNKALFGSDLNAKPRLHENVCWLSGHFYQKLRVLGWKGEWVENVGAKNHRNKWSEVVVSLPWRFSACHAPCAGWMTTRRLTTNRAQSFRPCLDDACQDAVLELLHLVESKVRKWERKKKGAGERLGQGENAPMGRKKSGL